jgi:DNA polymerase-3 subunit alpha
MPDIDIDFCRDGRERVIRYVQQKYGGPDRVSQIVTFGRMAARAVIRDVGRVLGVPLKDVDALAKRVPNGPKDTLSGAMESDPDLKGEVAKNPDYRRLIEIALKLEGMNRNASKHAAGVVIADAPLEEYVPLYRVGSDLTTQFTMDDLEPIGLLKMDFLGLRTLTILAKAIENIRRGGTPPPDLDHLPADDPETFRMLAAGEALGVFQLESSGMRDLLRRIRPDRFEDLATIVAVFRPGPMGSGMMDMYIERKNGREPVTYPHPSLESTLSETYGVVVYQEQVMRIANLLAGFDLAEADNLRKAMGKKKPEEMAKYREKFVEGCAQKGVPRERGEERDLGPARALRRVRLQQEPHDRVRRRHLPDRVPEAPPPARVHGGAPHLRDGRPRQGRRVRRGGAADGDRGPPAGRLPVGGGVHGRGAGDPVRSRRREGRRGGRRGRRRGRPR